MRLPWKKILYRQKQKNKVLQSLLAESNKQVTINKDEMDKKDTALLAIQQSLAEKKQLIKEQRENIYALEEETTKSREVYQQQLVQITSEKRKLIEEKTSILKEKACLIHQNEALLTE